MKKFVYIAIVSFFFTASCSTKKNTGTTRFYHGMTSKYNVLYNGNLALDKGIQELANKYEDNFWETIPIEPLAIDEDKFELPGKSKEGGAKTTFDIAEEKAVKAVQKHSISIGGKEHNKQIDDAYLLLGKSRYYSQRFVPALEAFDYVLKHYPKGDLNKDLIIWKAKTQIRLENEEQAIEALQNVLKSKKTEDRIQEEVHTALAMAYLALDSIPNAIKELKAATKTQENLEQYTRNLFVLGQLYKKEQHIDSAEIAFKEILNFKKSPYKYQMHSYMEQAKIANDSTPHVELKETIATLIKHYENREYLGELYYQAAQLDFLDNNEEEGVANLLASIRTPLIKDYQKGKSYEAVGNYYFDKAKFVKAGAYYDSVMPTVTNANTKRIRRLKRKRKSLEEVIFFETALKNNDSIFKIIAMTDGEKRAFFEDYVKKLKKTDELAAIRKENATRTMSTGSSRASSINQNNKLGSLSSGQPSLGQSSNPTSSTSKWYFYNPQTVGFGRMEFQKAWGKRKYQDNWRLTKNTGSNSDATTKTNTKNLIIVDESKKYDVDYYIGTLPTDDKVLATMKDESSKALYQLGLIYKEKFQVYPLAIERLERFLKEDPSEKQVLPAKYHLYKIYKILGDTGKTALLEQEIITEFPDSRYATIIQNPDKVVIGTKEGTPESHYEKVYCDYEFFEKYQHVYDECVSAIEQYKDEPIQPKFELLKSFAVYKLEGKEPFKNSLEYVVGNYPKTIEGERAQEILDLLNGVKKPSDEEIKNAEKAKEKKSKTSRRKKLQKQAASAREGRSRNEGGNNKPKNIERKGPRSFGK